MPVTYTILTENLDGVLVVRFNRPERNNAINNEMWLGIRDTFHSAAQDDDVLCVLLCGEKPEKVEKSTTASRRRRPWDKKDADDDS